jgi:hypothetical protein
MTERDLELLSAYLDSALTGEERAGLEVRLAQDADLRRELETLRETKALIVGLPRLRAPRNLTLTVAQVGGVSRRSPILLSPWVSIASAAAAFLLLMAGILLLGQAPAAQPQAVNIAVLPSATPRVVVPMTEGAQLAVTPPTMTNESIQQAVPLMAVESPTPIGTAENPAAMDAARTGDAPPTLTADEAAVMMENAPMGGFTTGTSENMAAGASSPASAPSDVTTMFAEPLAPTQPLPAMTQQPTSTPMPGLLQATVDTPGEISAEDVTPTQPFRDPISVGLIVGGMLLLFVAVVTTLLRMRR